MFWMSAVSAALACFPEANVLTSVAMLSAICVRTGRSCNARFIHCAAPRGGHSDREHEGKDDLLFRMRIHGFSVGKFGKSTRWSSIVGRSWLFVRRFAT